MFIICLQKVHRNITFGLQNMQKKRLFSVYYIIEGQKKGEKYLHLKRREKMVKKTEIKDVHQTLRISKGLKKKIKCKAKKEETTVSQIIRRAVRNIL